MKKPPKVLSKAYPRGLQFVRASGASDGLQGGLAQVIL